MKAGSRTGVDGSSGRYQPGFDVDPKGAEAFRGFRSDQGRKLLIDENRFIEQVLPGGVMRKLTDEEMAAYREPFLDPASRERSIVSPTSFRCRRSDRCLGHGEAYHAWLLDTEIPKLFFWAEPGSIISTRRADWLRARLKACRSCTWTGVHLSKGHADIIGRQIFRLGYSHSR